LTEPGPVSRISVGLVAVAAAWGGAAAGCHPTGSAGLDAAYPALVAALVTLAASRANRGVLLIAAAIGVAFSRSWLWLPAGAALALAFAAVLPRRRYPPVGALIGALVVQVALRWPQIGFHGLTVLVASALVLLVGISAWLDLSQRYRRLTVVASGAVLGLAAILSIPVVLTGLMSEGAVSLGSGAAQAALHDVSSGNAPEAVADLGKASGDLGRAHRRTDAWWTLGGQLVPFVAQQRRAIVEVTGEGHDVTAAAATEAGAINFHDLSDSHGRIDLPAIKALAGPVDALDSQIMVARDVIARSQSGWLVAPIAGRLSRLETELTKAGNEVDLAAEAVKDAPDLLGGDGVRHYLIVFMTPAETRGLDGLIGAYAEMTVLQGRITITRSGPSPDLSVPPPAPAPLLTGPPDYLARYGAFEPSRNFEDITYSPDFPTVENVLAQVYPQVGGNHIDGVLALDPYALAAMLQFTGPISVPGLPQELSSSNAAEVLLRQQYIDLPSNSQQNSRHNLLQEALSIGFSRLVSGTLPAPNQLASTLDGEVRQGRLLFWSSQPEVQPLLRRLGLDGAFPQPGPSSDVLAVTIADAANDKIDAYLDESISDHAIYNSSTGHVAASVAITLDNQAPSAGLPSSVIGSYHGSGLPSGTNYMWLSVYSPFDLTKATSDGRPANFAGGVRELGVLAYSAFVRIPAQTTVILDLSFDGYLTPGPTYRATLRLQPIANASMVDVSVSPTPGWIPDRADAGAWQAGSGEIQSHSWTFRR
jgi:hypothetical protein